MWGIAGLGNSLPLTVSVTSLQNRCDVRHAPKGEEIHTVGSRGREMNESKKILIGYTMLKRLSDPSTSIQDKKRHNRWMYLRLGQLLFPISS